MRVWLARSVADGALHRIHLRRQGGVLSRLAFALATGCGTDRGDRTKSARGALAFLLQSAHYRRELFAWCEQRLDGPSASVEMDLGSWTIRFSGRPYGIRSSFPVVLRPSRSRWACCASARG